MAEHDDPTVTAFIETDPHTGKRYAYVRCPYCGDAHMHGASDLAGELVLGNRLSHCISHEPAGYTLIAGPTGMTKPKRTPYRQRMRDLMAFERAGNRMVSAYVRN